MSVLGRLDKLESAISSARSVSYYLRSPLTGNRSLKSRKIGPALNSGRRDGMIVNRAYAWLKAWHNRRPIQKVRKLIKATVFSNSLVFGFFTAGHLFCAPVFKVCQGSLAQVSEPPSHVAFVASLDRMRFWLPHRGVECW